MKEDMDLINLWKSNGSNEVQAYYQNVKGELLRKARQSSKDIFQKIQINMQVELVLSVVLAGVFPFFFQDHPIFFWIMLVFIWGVFFVSLKLYLDYRKKMKAARDQDAVSSLGIKIGLLAGYIRKVYLTVYVVSPPAFVLGGIFAISDKPLFEISWGLVLFLVLFSLPFLFLVIWLLRKYIQTLYGRHLQKLTRIHASLTESEKE